MSQTSLTKTQSESESDTEESPLTRNESTSTVGATSAQAAAKTQLPGSSVDSGVPGYVADFLALPSQVFIMFFLEFLNSYRNFGLRFVQYQYISNEFDMTDVETVR